MTKEKQFIDEIRRVANWCNNASDDALSILSIWALELYDDEERVQHMTNWLESAEKALVLAHDAIISLSHMLEEMSHD